MRVTVQRTDRHDLPIPKAQTPHSAGIKLQAVHDAEIPAGAIDAIATGFSWQIPPGYLGLITQNPGLATLNGVVSVPYQVAPDVTGEVSVILHNTGKKKHSIKKGDCVALMVVLPAHSERAVREVPGDVLVVTAGIDTQDDRFEIQFDALGEGEDEILDVEGNEPGVTTDD